MFNDGEILVTDGIDNIKKAYGDIRAGTGKYRFLDLLNCDGGCIGGPAINNKNLSTGQKKEIIKKYVTRSSEKTMGRRHGKIDDAVDIDISAIY